MATAPNPIRIEVRAPKITRLKTSLPWMSVPNGMTQGRPDQAIDDVVIVVGVRRDPSSEEPHQEQHGAAQRFTEDPAPLAVEASRRLQSGRAIAARSRGLGRRRCRRRCCRRRCCPASVVLVVASAADERCGSESHGSQRRSTEQPPSADPVEAEAGRVVVVSRCPSLAWPKVRVTLQRRKSSGYALGHRTELAAQRRWAACHQPRISHAQVVRSQRYLCLHALRCLLDSTGGCCITRLTWSRDREIRMGNRTHISTGIRIGTRALAMACAVIVLIAGVLVLEGPRPRPVRRKRRTARSSTSAPSPRGTADCMRAGAGPPRTATRASASTAMRIATASRIAEGDRIRIDLVVGRR